MNDHEKLKVDVLQKDLEALRKIETWGSSLFLGAIALLAKQFILWDRAGDLAERVELEPWTFTAPAVIGLVAFIFLRIVNFRGHSASMDLRRMINRTRPSERTSWGALGLFLAVMPLAFGYAVSWLLVHSDSERRTAMFPLWWLGAIFLLVSLTMHIVVRVREAKPV